MQPRNVPLVCATQLRVTDVSGSRGDEMNLTPLPGLCVDHAPIPTSYAVCYYLSPFGLGVQAANRIYRAKPYATQGLAFKL